MHLETLSKRAEVKTQTGSDMQGTTHLLDKDLLKVRKAECLVRLYVGHFREAEGCVEDCQKVKSKADHCQAVEYLGDTNADSAYADEERTLM